MERLGFGERAWCLKEDQGRDQWAGRDPDLPEQPARLGDTDMLSQVRSGGVEFFTLSALILATLVPVASIMRHRLRLPRLRPGLEGDGRANSALMSAARSKVNLYVMEKIWDNGFRQMTSSGKARSRSPADIKGFKIRVPVSPLWTSMFKALDAAPASINFAEVYSALQTKIVDGQENPLAIIRPPSSMRCRRAAR
jgi:TRAP-type C4-dicarboxylate transport system substrate-binding protein